MHRPLDERRIRTLIALLYVAVILALYGYFVVRHPTRERDSLVPARVEAVG
jgi:hypothetical protein